MTWTVDNILSQQGANIGGTKFDQLSQGSETLYAALRDKNIVIPPQQIFGYTEDSLLEKKKKIFILFKQDIYDRNGRNMKQKKGV